VNLHRFPKYARAMAMAFLIGTALAANAEAQGGAQNQQAAPSGDAQKGKQLFTNYGCYQCHGREGQGGVAGPRIAPNPIALQALTRYVRQPGGQMPPYTEKVVSDAELADIHAYLQSRPQPRPAREIPLLND
jgi:ubiquinol-cytochrome c reductase cytochrome c subunit